MDHFGVDFLSDVRWKQRFSNFKKALGQLESAVTLSDERELSALERAGLIKAFEFTFELSWDVMKDYLLESGVSGIVGSKGAIREAFSNGLISDGEGWMEMVSNRNLASHTYDDDTAENLANTIRQKYLGLFKEFSRRMKEAL